MIVEHWHFTWTCPLCDRDHKWFWPFDEKAMEGDLCDMECENGCRPKMIWENGKWVLADERAAVGNRSDIETQVEDLFECYNEAYACSREEAASKVVAHLLIEQSAMLKDMLESIDHGIDSVSDLVDGRTR